MTNIITNLQMADVAYKLDLLPPKYRGNPEMYMIDVLTYYKTDTAAYNKSMRYYGEHPEDLKKIYIRVEKNLQEYNK